MAHFSQISAILLLLLALFQQTHISFSLTCSSQTFKNRLFQQCTDLPKLKSYLHWTYDSSKSSLDIAFEAPPAKPDGWVSWAINPTSTGMGGSQALVAYRQSDGSMIVKKYNITSYKIIQPGNLSFEVPKMEAEYVNGVIRIYATILLPESLGKVLNQVWQVGPSINNGMLGIHDFKPDNLNSLGKLDLMSGSGDSNGDGNGLDTKSTCSSQKFSKNRLFQHCSDLPKLKSYLHWTYDSSKSSLDIAFEAPPAKPDGWVAWAINPTATGMGGSQTLVAYRQSDGSMVVKTYNIASYKIIQQGNLSFEVPKMEAEYVNGVIRIYATIILPASLGKVLNHVWQVGPSINNGMLGVHDFKPENLNSLGKLDLLSGSSNSIAGGGGANSKLKKRNIHGILNAVSWGILFPIGATIARYLRTFKSADPAWFYLHVFCQLSAYIIGVAGWGTGLKLGSQSKGITYSTHRNLGIALFSIATLQMFALFLRPRKDHKTRPYWNIYHHGLGYVVLILGIFNVFKGLDILQPADKWKTAYIIFLSVLGGIVLFLEVITWIIVLKRKSGNSSKSYVGPQTNGRQQPLAI